VPWSEQPTGRGANSLFAFCLWHMRVLLIWMQPTLLKYDIESMKARWRPAAGSARADRCMPLSAGLGFACSVGPARARSAVLTEKDSHTKHF
jgi:hypothetical protein